LATHLRQDSGLLADGDRTVVAICRSDARAAFAVRRLRRAGFKRVLVMSGGMLGWLADDLPVEHDDR
jgi:rhodanese-related sulfurtransferase